MPHPLKRPKSLATAAKWLAQTASSKSLALKIGPQNLRAQEAELEQMRKDACIDYSATQHVQVLAALICALGMPTHAAPHLARIQ